MGNSKPSLGITTSQLSQMAVLTALFVIASAIPLTAFIGGAGFITLGIIIVPVIARLLKPRLALITGLAAAIAVYALQTATAPVFGPISLIIPLSGILLGSFGFHSKLGSLIPWAYVCMGAVVYLVFAGGTIIWLAPYLLVAASLPAVFLQTRWKTPVLCLYSSMCELTTMTMGSIFILRLPSALWLTITPFMFFERTVATFGSFAIITGLARAVPELIAE